MGLFEIISLTGGFETIGKFVLMSLELFANFIFILNVFVSIIFCSIFENFADCKTI
jgi:hypothetical protein